MWCGYLVSEFKVFLLHVHDGVRDFYVDGLQDLLDVLRTNQPVSHQQHGI